MELSFGTDPLLGDTDRDGLQDGFEVRNNLDPLKPWGDSADDDAEPGADAHGDANLVDVD
jgi:hypothetical protein